MTKRTYYSLILILGSLTALAPFSIDMYLPGFPAIAKDLDTTPAKVSLTLSGFFIGISAGQLLYGPLLDHFGRKKPLYFGLSLYILASIACIWVKNIDSLIVLRFIEAIGACVATVASVAMVRDLFPVQDSAKVFSLLMLVLGVSPMVAPTVGGIVTANFGWQAVFIILSVIGAVLLLAVILWLPNSFKPDPSHSLKPEPIIRDFISVIVEPQFYTYALTGAISFAGLFAYVSGSPMIFMSVFKVNEQVYGWIFAFLSIGFIGASQLNNLVLRRFKSEQIIPVALRTQLLIGIVFLIASYNDWLNLGITIFMLFLFLSCIGFANPNMAALSLAPFSKNAGTASALMGAIQMGMGSLISVVISMFDEPSTLPMIAAMAGSASIANIVYLVGKRTIKHEVEVGENAEAGLVH
ncbi:MULTISPECIES: multidrug effflux MFS transporter [unclassified Arcicella]|uniref:multidrug effflux MFS transporter n=1 Tax=unclassified Arcicella TaxID=2644986 RepID=UPI00286080EC|nr:MULTISPECIES: multidrug effflux MFS transporter [unclassified Arcicella]MDR6562748.1 DHA1 family bicyclomycin/chloramphenicol resistance-like MFS transporter [Arcicella sp. BE51]MDR6812907.1 DHA1 family bicyclomycin/chloramphenicol resistance-like MFS transporter [Arcicella sp. BE140]MDR6824221.1 DHA1 family bicyclomycin/chloramphenicol resistance-like MFS transporter [Arcicella sp. BE139]